MVPFSRSADKRDSHPTKQKAPPLSSGASQTKSYTLNEDPQPQVLFTFGFSNLNPAPSSVST